MREIGILIPCTVVRSRGWTRCGWWIEICTGQPQEPFSWRCCCCRCYPQTTTMVVLVMVVVYPAGWWICRCCYSAHETPRCRRDVTPLGAVSARCSRFRPVALPPSPWRYVITRCDVMPWSPTIQSSSSLYYNLVRCSQTVGMTAVLFENVAVVLHHHPNAGRTQRTRPFIFQILLFIYKLPYVLVPTRQTF